METMKTLLIAAVAAAMPCVVPAAEAGGEASGGGWAYRPGEGVSFAERPVVSAEVSLAFDSKFLTYGLVDNPEPILSPEALVTLFDWVQLKAASIFDLTGYGRRAGYGDRAWRYQELDPSARLVHRFSAEDVGWLPTSVSVEAGYMYEQHPRAVCDDTQFVWVELSLPDLWVEPTLQFERDIDRDDGTYLNLELGRSFAVVGDGESPTLSLRPSVAQGWGDRRRVAGYLSRSDGGALERAGLMDTLVRLAAEWRVCDWLALSGYVGYSDYLFDRHLREAARRYEITGDCRDSFQFVCGLELKASF